MPQVRSRLAIAAALTGALVLPAGPTSAEPMLHPSAVRLGGPLLEVASRIPAMTPLPQGYAFKYFVSPRRRDAFGCGWKRSALVSAAVTKPRVLSGCRLRGGAWNSSGDGGRITSWKRVRAIPVLSMPEAWAQGAFDWSESERRVFATAMPMGRGVQGGSGLARKAAMNCQIDRDGVALGCTYAIVDKSRARGARSLQDLIVKDPQRATCSDVRAVVALLSAWGLAMDPDTRPALLAKSAACEGYGIRVVQVLPAPSVRGVNSRNPFLPAGGTSMLPSIDAVLQAPAGPMIDRNLFGLHIPKDAPTPSIPYGVQRLWDSDAGWNVLEPERGRFDWTTMDAAVNRARAAGTRLIYVLGPTPTWAGPRATDPPRDLGTLKAFVAAIKQRYGNAIYAIEVWNEPNLQTFFTGSTRDLVAMTKAVKEATAGTSILTLSPSTTTRATPSLYRFFREYLRGLRAAGWPVDGFSFHSYPRASGGPGDNAAGIALFKGMLISLGAPDLPLLDTEINYGLGGLSEPQRAITGEEAQGYIAQTFVDAVRYGVANVSWYLWTARDYPLLGIQLNPQSDANRAAWTWTYDTLVGASFTGCTEQGSALVCGFFKDGSRFLLASSASGIPSEVRLPIGWTTACSMDGRCSATGGAIVVGIRPTLLRHDGGQ